MAGKRAVCQHVHTQAVRLRVVPVAAVHSAIPLPKHAFTDPLGALELPLVHVGSCRPFEPTPAPHDIETEIAFVFVAVGPFADAFSVSQDDLEAGKALGVIQVSRKRNAFTLFSSSAFINSSNHIRLLSASTDSCKPKCVLIRRLISSNMG